MAALEFSPPQLKGGDIVGYSKIALQIALGSVSIQLEEASTLGELKGVIEALIDSLNDNLCEGDEEDESSDD